MKLQFKEQDFQTQACDSISNIFNGQPKKEMNRYRKDIGVATIEQVHLNTEENTHFLSEEGFENAEIKLSNEQLLKNIRSIQMDNGIKPDTELIPCNIKIKDAETKKTKAISLKNNFTIEMETGTGKTYTYIKTMYELNEKYGWTKFIIVVPSVAIREGVYKTFDITEEHFMEKYNKKIRYFIYNSSNLSEIDNFASDSGINVMIINSQAFNSTGKEARKIYMKLDTFRSRRPIDIIAKTNPILIIDEPQSTEGKKTQERLIEFNPLMILRYSATHKDEYNMLYRLDAMESYNRKLVKKIAVKGISAKGSTGTDGYLYLQEILTHPNKNPTAIMEFEKMGTNEHKKVIRHVEIGYNFYDNSNGLEEYKNNFVISDINALNGDVTFLNGLVMRTGDVIGEVNEMELRRLQIRETIISHIEKEATLFNMGIKVLSLFFIDEVSKYRVYNEDVGVLGEYAKMFEEEYQQVLEDKKKDFAHLTEYIKYLDSITIKHTHNGYFATDKNKKFIDGDANYITKSTKDEKGAYDLIMKDKERLLSFEEPTRFIFSHSALKEGWDNPNVFQICTLKKSSNSEVRSRQEIGRGLRICVDNTGLRMDNTILDSTVHDINKLTVVTDFEFEEYVKNFQQGLADNVKHRIKKIDTSLFEDRKFKSNDGIEEIIVDEDVATEIYEDLVRNNYVKSGKLTEKYFEDEQKGVVSINSPYSDYSDAIIKTLSSIYDEKSYTLENERNTEVTARINEDNFYKKEFQELWKNINRKSAYIVDFNEKEIVEKSIKAINEKLRVSEVVFSVVTGELNKIKSKEELEKGTAFSRDDADKNKTVKIQANDNVKYDLIGKMVLGTNIIRNSVVEILKGIDEKVFEQFKNNPEEFVVKINNFINEEKATAIIEHITYDVLNDTYDKDIFTDPKLKLKGKLGVNAMPTDKKHIYDYVITDSKIEKDMAKELEVQRDVCVYAKLPSGFYINTPVGKYNPDWAIAFNDGAVKHIYFVAETKGSMNTLQLRGIEKLKKECAKKHFKTISSDTVKYDVVSTYEELLSVVNKD